MWVSLLDACGLVAIVLFAFFVIQLVRLAFSDADLTLQFCTRFGKKPENELSGKIVWITGASSGIGESLAYALAKCGARLILSARREEELKRVVEQCSDREKHMILPLDLLKYDTHHEAVQKVIARFGKVDYLVNNAGRSQRAVAVDTSLDVDRAVLELNTLGTLSLTKAMLPHLIKQGGGAIVVISSVAGKIGSPGSASYSASKHAVQGFFDTLRMEIADTGVSILSVCPGPVESKSYEAIFTTEIGKAPPPAAGLEPEKPGSRVTGERCAYLISVAMANRLDEVWISLHPVLLFTYAAQYLPGLAMGLGKRLGNRRLKALQAGKQDINGSFFKKVDYLVNNAGRSQRAVAVDTSLDVDRAVLELNTLGTLSLTKAMLPHLIKQGGGAIVVISSVAGKIGSPGSASYSASKHAVQGFFDTLRMEIADTGVSILSVCPGPVESKSYEAIFTTEIGKAPPPAAGLEPEKPGSRVTGERCAYLISVAMANRLDEVWISLHPVLLFTYAAQYLPGLAMGLGKRLGNRRLKALQAGKQDINGSFFKKVN